MKVFVLLLALLGIIACAFANNAHLRDNWPPPTDKFPYKGQKPGTHFVRQEANLQRIIEIHGKKRSCTTADAYGGYHSQQRQLAQPHAGIQFERSIGDNGFIRGHGQLERRQLGGVSPLFGVNGGFQFRRGADNFEDASED